MRARRPYELRPRKRPSQARSRDTVAVILRAAARVFATQGYAAGTTNRIAEAAGVSVGSLYEYFPNKDALLVALMEAHIAEGRTLLEDAAAGVARQRLGLRETVRRFTESEVEPQAEEHDASGELNRALLRRCGELGLLGLTVPEEHGGAGMDAVAAVIAHHELAKADPGFTLAYLAHYLLFVNNFYNAASEEQRARLLPGVLSGEVKDIRTGEQQPADPTSWTPEETASAAPPE